MYVCLWSPDWSTAVASAAEVDDAPAPSSYDVAPLLAELAPRLRVEREMVWADGRGLDAGWLAGRLLERLAGEGVAARAGVAAVPVTAELAARWGAHGERDPDGPTPFLVKERTGWGHRRSDAGRSPEGAGKEESAAREKAAHPPSPHRRREGAEAGDHDATPRTRVRDEAGDPPSGAGAGAGSGRAVTGGVVVVEKGWEVEWQSALPVSALRPAARVKTLLDGVGIATVGQLAGLAREAVEVRFGGGAVALWRAAQADDRRLLFDRIPPERPHGSLDFVDYVLTDPARLLFTANALLGPLCDRLTRRGEHARALRIALPLANGETWARTIRPARPTAGRDTWLRLIRGLLDRLTVPDAVAGMRIEVASTEAAAVRQGDLFDRGFATASAVEAAVARLAERQVWPVAPETDAHPRLERRGDWKRRDIAEVGGAHRGQGGEGHPQSPHRGSGGVGLPQSGGGEGRGLTLQLMSEPRRITVETLQRRDHEVPIRLRDRTGWREVAHAAGPDRISGGQWEGSSYAREYFRCVTGEGVPLWVFRDAMAGGWYLHGWWD